jgi:hypothetical protein
MAFCLILIGLLGVAQVPASSYKVYTGRVGEVEATLHLTQAGKKVGGWIWFNRTPRPMPIYSDGLGSDSLTVSAAASPINVTLTGILSATGFAGRSELQKEGSPSKNAGFTLKLSADTTFTPFDFVFAEGKAEMPPKAENESTAEYFAASIWPKPTLSKAFGKTIKTVVNKELENKGAPLEPGKIFVTDKNKFLAGWKVDMAKLSPKDAKEMGQSNSQQIENKVEVMYEDSRLISLSHYNYVFSGGAHGNYGTSIINIDKRTGAIIKLKDVLTDEGIKAMPKILEAVIRQQYGLDKNKTLEQNSLFVKTMAPSDNFYITNGNIGFLYMPYAIMAYVYGEPNIYIPASMVAKYVKPAFK